MVYLFKQIKKKLILNLLKKIFVCQLFPLDQLNLNGFKKVYKTSKILCFEKIYNV